MKNIVRIFAVLLLALTLNMSTPQVTQAQCPMCRMSAESNLRNGGTAGRGLNSGILYMLATPYIIVGLIGYMWYRNRKKSKEEEKELTSFE